MNSSRNGCQDAQQAAASCDGSSSSGMSVTSYNAGDGATGGSSHDQMQLEARRARRRHRSKINQRKYRAWQRAANNQLQHDVNELQTHTKRLESHVLALYNGERFLAEEKSIQEYVRLFAHGFDRSERQVTFLRYFMAPDVWCGGQTT
ncbi:hypothetical protein, variant 2 [Aphanomyces invadans]|uniref:BZIP domain-containing protein n=1 Tax=Aphanomyces invadans TaxID=157072 RepID=A0A024U9H7_9STRA|nr:hypothetical protein, variant 1 [Aphanomyces invadans]XP_008868245.1 hypothetical protein, variant 2 [Aphanomyces invadans]ETW02860.1 hypothetical protein, variant 1 [Aphanomyces invadans]ETW02861.1 hypothetical protein, variant 2 [Aphanomyces invadans]|eukprot:XP_008868244.1 hypothetical protein, variant 1 [Aphanomyces invadans]